MNELQPYVLDAQLSMHPTLGKHHDNIFFTERCHYEDDLVIAPIPESYIQENEIKGSFVYKLVIEVVMKHGRPSWDSSWRFQPALKSFHIAFADTTMERIMEQALTWIKERIDTTIEPFEFKNGSFYSIIQPLVFKTKNYPHYLEDEK